MGLFLWLHYLPEQAHLLLDQQELVSASHQRQQTTL